MNFSFPTQLGNAKMPKKRKCTTAQEKGNTRTAKGQTKSLEMDSEKQ